MIDRLKRLFRTEHDTEPVATDDATDYEVVATDRTARESFEVADVEVEYMDGDVEQYEGVWVAMSDGSYKIQEVQSRLFESRIGKEPSPSGLYPEPKTKVLIPTEIVRHLRYVDIYEKEFVEVYTPTERRPVTECDSNG